MSDNELEHFKREISLSEYVQSVGFTLDRTKSSTRTKVFQRGPDKILVFGGSDGHAVYRNERNHAERGSVIDFVMFDSGCSLGHARTILRSYPGNNLLFPSCPSLKPSTATSKDDEGFRRKATAVWQVATWTPEPAYLLSRGLLPDTLNHPMFTDTFRVDRNGNVLFPHFDRFGRCGYELRNAGLKTFGANTKRGLWYTKNCCSTLHIVICESSIDCMSYFQLHGGDFGYVSLGGAIGERQRDLLTGLFDKAALRSAKVIVATDNDLAGEQYFAQMQALSNFALERQTPRLKDWNDDLCNR